MSVGEAPSLAIPAVGAPAAALAGRSRAKRLLDVTLAAVVLLLASPIVAACAVAILLDGGGPVFFVQERVGLRGRTFRMWKLRTMIRDAELLRLGLGDPSDASFPAFKMADDPRVTRVGRLLRRASLDELPQLWNVIRGDMSVVGPRPALPAEVAYYDARAMRRLEVRPGLTCLWQVHYRHRHGLTFEEWLDLDLRYIREWSLWWDLVLIARTIPVVVRMTGS